MQTFSLNNQTYMSRHFIRHSSIYICQSYWQQHQKQVRHQGRNCWSNCSSARNSSVTWTWCFTLSLKVIYMISNTVNTGDLPQHCIHCVFLVTFVICFTHRVVKAVGLQFLQGFIWHLNQCFFLLCGDSRCSLCPEKWLWWMGRCYFFSVGLQENRQWNESAEFCLQHNSSLVVIEDSAEMVNAPCTSHVNHTHLQFWSCTYQHHFKLLRTFGPLYFTASLQFVEICKPFFIHSL